MTGTGIGSGDLDACLRLWHAAGVTQADMAALAGVSRPTIARALKRLGLRDPRRRRMAEIAGDARREPALTFADLARRHGCSVSTVQRALRSHTPERKRNRMKPAILCLLIASIACATPEERLEELEHDFNQAVATFEEVGEILDEATELAHRPASREALRDARRELEELKAVWDDVLVHVAAAEEVIETEGYYHWGLGLEQTQQHRDRRLARHDEAIAHGSAANVARTRQLISAETDAARRRIDDAQEIIGRPARQAAQRDQAMRHLADLEKFNERLWAHDPRRGSEVLDQVLAHPRARLESDDPEFQAQAIRWITDNLERLRSQLADRQAAEARQDADRAAQREQALRDLAELDRHHERVLDLRRAIRDAHTDPWEKRWADDARRLYEDGWRQDLADVRQKLESDETWYGANWIADALHGAPQELDQLRRELDQLRAAVTSEP